MRGSRAPAGPKERGPPGPRAGGPTGRVCSGLVFIRSLTFDFCSVVAVTPGVGSEWE